MSNKCFTRQRIIIFNKIASKNFSNILGPGRSLETKSKTPIIGFCFQDLSKKVFNEKMLSYYNVIIFRSFIFYFLKFFAVKIFGYPNNEILTKCLILIFHLQKIFPQNLPDLEIFMSSFEKNWYCDIATFPWLHGQSRL